MRVIICGSRDYEREIMVNVVLDGLYKEFGDNLYVIEGGAKGADYLADQWCRKNWPGNQDIRHHWKYPAEWDKYAAGDRWRAGHDRNQKMLDEGILEYPDEPSAVFAFKDNFNWKLDKGGTENMVRIAKEAGVPAFVITKVE